MKSLFKVTLLATTMAVVLNAPLAMAAETTPAAAPAQQAPKSAAFKNDDQQSAYALGASLRRHMENSLKEHAKRGIKLDKDQFISRAQDAFARKSKKGEAFAAKFDKEKGVKKTEHSLLPCIPLTEDGHTYLYCGIY
jgi:FKBP-type peptidyl-prolyl cis-trans isomerase FkpA